MKKTLSKTLWYIVGGIIVAVIALPFCADKNMLRSFNTSMKNDEARIDIYNNGTANNTIEVTDTSNENIAFSFPQWCKTQNGQCSVVTINKFDGPVNIKITAKKAGELMIRLMGPDVRYNNQRYPVFVNYSNFVVNGTTVFEGTKAIFHDQPYKYTTDVKDGETIDISVDINHHYFGFSDLKYFHVNYVRLASIVITYFIIVGLIVLYRKKKAKKSK